MRYMLTICLFILGWSAPILAAEPATSAEDADAAEAKQRVQELKSKGPTTLSTLRDGFRWIFDGKTLKGWHKNPKPVGHGTGGQWTVSDGAITGQQDPPGSGNGGILLSDEKYGDVEIYFEVKIDWGCDSGFFLRSTEQGACYQVMIDYHDNGNIGEIFHEGTDGRGNRTHRLDGVFEEVNGQRELRAVRATPITDSAIKSETPFDLKHWPKRWKANDWNELHVKITGDPPTIITELNGHPMTRYIGDKKYEQLGGRNHLALQVHGGAGLWPTGARVQFCNIQVKELDAKGETK